MRNANPHMDYLLRTMMREANDTSTLWFPDSCILAIGSAHVSHRFNIHPTLCKVFSLRTTEAVSILISSISYSIVHQMWHILPPKGFSHSIPVSLFYFKSLSFTWTLQCFLIVLFLFTSHPFSVLPISMIQMKCPSPRSVSRSAFEPASTLH